MKFIVISQKITVVRVWRWNRFRFVWYRTLRGLTDWHEIEIKKRQAPFDIAKVAKSLAERDPNALKDRLVAADTKAKTKKEA